MGKRKLSNEMNDSVFIMKAAINGDLQALKIYRIILDINQGEQDFIKNSRDYSQELKLELLNLIHAKKQERDYLIYHFNLGYKKAKIYLDELKRIKREERAKLQLKI